jgi:hypothetical protein
MNQLCSVLRRFWLLAVGGSVIGMLSCIHYASNGQRELHDGYPRGPGSFCALNPEGCPPASPPAKASPGAFDLRTCLDACEAGGVVLESYCRGLKQGWQRELCWSVVLGSKAACRGMCYRLHDCETSANCPERKE